MKRLLRFLRGIFTFEDGGTEEQPRVSRWLIIPFVVAVGAVALLYYRQQVLLVPVPARPLTGARVDSRRLVGFTWTHVPREKAVYHVQVSADRRFKSIVFETRVTDVNEVKQKGIVKQGKSYYWRMRSITNGKPSPWTRKMRFYAD